MDNVVTITYVDTVGAHNCGCSDCTQCSRVYTDYAKDRFGKVYFNTSLYESTRKVGSKESSEGWDQEDL